jgi:hypothetical protein
MCDKREERTKKYILASTYGHFSFASFNEKLHSPVALIALQLLMVLELLLPLISTCRVNRKLPLPRIRFPSRCYITPKGLLSGTKGCLGGGFVAERTRVTLRPCPIHNTEGAVCSKDALPPLFLLRTLLTFVYMLLAPPLSSSPHVLLLVCNQFPAPLVDIVVVKYFSS